MEKEIFDDCLQHWKNADGKTKYWTDLAIKWGYGEYGGERLRSDFKNNRKKLGITKEQNDIRQHTNFNIPRVGVVDLETLPMLVFSWGIFDQNIGLEQIVHDSCLLSWAGKILNDPTMYSDIMTSKESLNRDDKRITQTCWNFLSSCDVVIGHNFAGFDNKVINTAFLKHGLPPLKFVIIDTLMVARQNFKFASNKLAYINKKLGIRQKIENEGFPLWRGCHEGDAQSLSTMLAYNEGDIYSTEDLFYRIRPYVKNFNVALYNETDEIICPVCGGNDLNHVGYYMTSAGKWDSIRCTSCGCLSRAKTNHLSTTKKKSLLINS